MLRRGVHSLRDTPFANVPCFLSSTFSQSSLSGQLPLLAASAAAGSSPPPDSLRQLQAAARCLAHVAVAAPAHPDLRLARTHEALAHVLLCCGLGLGQDAQSGAGVAGRIAVPGVWALQGLCALAVDRACAADLAALGVLPHLTAALEALAEATLSAAAAAADGHSGGGAPERQPSGALPTVRPSGDLAAGGGHKAAAVRTGGGGGGGSQPLAGDVAHVVALALQNMSSHKPLAAAAVQAGAVHAICKVGQRTTEGGLSNTCLLAGMHICLSVCTVSMCDLVWGLDKSICLPTKAVSYCPAMSDLFSPLPPSPSCCSPPCSGWACAWARATWRAACCAAAC